MYVICTYISAWVSVIMGVPSPRPPLYCLIVPYYKIIGMENSVGSVFVLLGGGGGRVREGDIVKGLETIF